MSYLFSFILNPVYCDAPEPWQIGFQDGASPTFEGITELHNAIFFYLVVILVGVVWVMGSVVANFSSSKSSIIYKYANHGYKGVSPMGVIRIILFMVIIYTYFGSTTLVYAQMSVQFVSMINPKGKRNVIAVKGSVPNSSIQTVDISPTYNMLQAMNSFKQMLTDLEALEDKTVSSWLMSQPDVKLLMDNKLAPVTFKVKDDNIVAEQLQSGEKPSTSNTGVYIFFDDSGASYVGSAMSFLMRYLQHKTLFNKHLRYLKAGNNIPKEANSQFYRYMGQLPLGIFELHWGVLCTKTPLVDNFCSDNPNYKLTSDELQVLNRLTQFFIRVQEHVMMETIKPTLNADSVKFSINWTEVSSDMLNTYNVVDADTGQVITVSSSKKGLVRITGKTLNQVNDYLDHVASFYCTQLDTKVWLRTVGSSVPLKTGAVQTSWVTKEPLNGFDVSTLPDGQVYLLDLDKNLTDQCFSSSTNAAWLLDAKTDHQYIHRYINVERPVETTQGTYYFVQNTALERVRGSSPKPNAGTSGKKSSIIVHDNKFDVYVEFTSKNKLGLFLWGKPKTGGGTFDRYLLSGVVFKDRLRMYNKNVAPTDITIITNTQYFELLGSDRFL